MTRKIIASLLLVSVLASAGEYLARIELTGARLEPLAARGLRILAELENCALVLIDESNAEEFQGTQF